MNTPPAVCIFFAGVVLGMIIMFLIVVAISLCQAAARTPPLPNPLRETIDDKAKQGWDNPPSRLPKEEVSTGTKSHQTAPGGDVTPGVSPTRDLV